MKSVIYTCDQCGKQSSKHDDETTPTTWKVIWFKHADCFKHFCSVKHYKEYFENLTNKKPTPVTE